MLSSLAAEVPSRRSPHGGGLWGVSPHKTKRGGELPPLAHPPRVGPKTLASPQPTGVGKTGGPGGRSPHGGGLWGVSPHKTKRGSELPPLTSQPRVGPKKLANPQPAGVGKTGGPGGRSPHVGGLWGVSPRKTKRGSELPALATQPRVGPKTLASPQPTGVGKTGVQGAKPPGGRYPPQKTPQETSQAVRPHLRPWPICFAHVCML
jgi:hypothetical protein